MGRRIAKHNPTSIERNSSQEVAANVFRDNPEYVKDSTFDIFSYVESLPEIELKMVPLGDDISGYIEKVNCLGVLVPDLIADSNFSFGINNSAAKSFAAYSIPKLSSLASRNNVVS